MAFGQLNNLIGHLRRLVAAPERCGLSDSLLLERWVQLRDEAAFEVLLWRHGPLVLSVCKRLLRDQQDAEDAFQATFLTLLRKAGSIRRAESVAGWLYRVAYRVALRAGASRRTGPELLDTDLPAPDSETELLWRDLRPVLDEEVNGLPARYRTAFVLCYFQGKTNAEAATEIGCPVGTVLSRLNWARQRLRRRLERRGLTLTAGLLAVLLVERAMASPAPAGLVQATFQAGLAYTLGEAAGGAVSAKVLTLTHEVIRAMFFAKLKVAAVMLAVTVIGLGAGTAVYQTWAADPPAAQKQASDPATPKPPAPVDKPGEPLPQKEYQDAPSQQDGILLVIGRALGDKDECPADREIKVKIGDQVRRFRKLKVGDKVEPGQMVAMMDPQLAQNDLEILKSKARAAKADWEASLKTRDEAQERWKTLEKIRDRSPTAVALDELRAAKLTYDRYFFDEVHKRENIVTAELEMKRAETVLRTFEIRCGVPGVIVAINHRPGEAIKKFEPVVRIRVADEER